MPSSPKDLLNKMEFLALAYSVRTPDIVVSNTFMRQIIRDLVLAACREQRKISLDYVSDVCGAVPFTDEAVPLAISETRW